jgi:tetratricopeptide (TPR) repeat protein
VSAVPTGGPEAGGDARVSSPLPGRPDHGPVLERGRTLLTAADRARGRDAADEARSLGLRAAAELELGARLAARAGAEPTVCARALLDLARARAIAAEDEGHAGVLEALTRAVEALRGRRTRVRVTALRRLAEAHAARWRRTADPAELRFADDRFAEAEALLERDDPERAALLTGRGEALVARAEQGEGLQAATDAVRVLRAALALTADSDPHLSGRRLLFGRALRHHHAAGGAPTDLHEAEWVLARAARGAPDDRTAALAWLERGDALLALASRTGAPEWLDLAAESYHHAVRSADRADEPLLSARAHHLRATVLERTAGPEHALEAYRAAWTRWQRAGAARGVQARSTYERMKRLAHAGGR